MGRVLKYDPKATAAYYADRLARYGQDHRSLDWGSRASQWKRFAALAGVADLRGTSLLDIGCGLADFYAYLEENGIEANYAGLDITPEMIEAAHGRFPQCKFTVGDALKPMKDVETDAHRAEYVVASGIFTYTNEAFLKQAITAMYARCGRALAFNSLSAWAEQKEAGEFYADPLATVQFCRTLTPRIVLRHDYMPHDFTVYLYREDQP